ncbi:hypothetical protein BHE74_00035160 [Ensete ventricosum]|nr:hypothetical protein BHE74_00035160 [Ensete ventricosum]
MGNWEEKDWASSIKSLEPKNVVAVVAGSRNSLAICGNGQRGTLGHPPETKTESVPSLVDALAGVKIVQQLGAGIAWLTGGNEYGQCGEEPERKEDGSRALRRDIAIPQRCAPKLSVRQVIGIYPMHLTIAGMFSVFGIPCTTLCYLWLASFHVFALYKPGSCWRDTLRGTDTRWSCLDLGPTMASWRYVLIFPLSFGYLLIWFCSFSQFLNYEDLSTLPAWSLFYTCLCSTQISTPVRVQGLERVRLIAVGAFHNLALLEDGTLWAWGNNEYGQLGTGDTQPRSQPIPVQGLSGLTLVCNTNFVYYFHFFFCF